MERYKAIALLDSGVGGLTVAREIFRQLPHENIIYFGDTAHFPYGPRPHSQVRSFVCEILDFFRVQGIKMVIIACNSATAAGLEHYEKRINVPLLGVIEPGIKEALKHTQTNKIGVIGTAGTILSGAYQEIFGRLNKGGARLYSQPCPLFVLIVENGLVDSPEAKRVAEEYLKPLKDAKIDTLILGCTHYPLMSSVIQEVMGPGVKLISSAKETARKTKVILEKKGLLNPQACQGSAVTTQQHRFFVSGPAKPFTDLAVNLLGKDIKAYQVILPHQFL
ncbi:MAG: glutamate racemase [Firmicutes bacterium]|nr:glutamate racemase [Bacillota bacterium]